MKYSSRFLIALFSLAILFSNSVTSIVAETNLTVTTFPPLITAGQEFEISFLADGLGPDLNYNIKGLGGENFTQIDTWNSNWLQQNAAWAKMPVFLTNPEGSASGSLRVRFEIETQVGAREFKLRVKKSDSDEGSFDSPVVTLNVIAVTLPPTSSPTEVVIVTPTPTKTPSPTPAKLTPNTPSPTPAEKTVPSPTGEILGLSEVVQTPIPENPQAFDNELKKPFPFFALILVGSGILLVGISSFLAFKKKETLPTPPLV